MGTVRKKGEAAKNVSSVPMLKGCHLCGCGELYRRKDFPRAAGLGIVLLAVVLVFWFENYLPLFAAAAIDLILYFFVRDVHVCYQCGAEHKGLSFEKEMEVFDIAVADRFRFGKAYKGPRSTLD